MCRVITIRLLLSIFALIRSILYNVDHEKKMLMREVGVLVIDFFCRRSIIQCDQIYSEFPSLYTRYIVGGDSVCTGKASVQCKPPAGYVVKPISPNFFTPHTAIYSWGMDHYKSLNTFQTCILGGSSSCMQDQRPSPGALQLLMGSCLHEIGLKFSNFTC